MQATMTVGQDNEQLCESVKAQVTLPLFRKTKPQPAGKVANTCVLQCALLANVGVNYQSVFEYSSNGEAESISCSIQLMFGRVEALDGIHGARQLMFRQQRWSALLTVITLPPRGEDRSGENAETIGVSQSRSGNVQRLLGLSRPNSMSAS